MTEYTSDQDFIDIASGETARILSGAVIGAPPSQTGPTYAIQMGASSELLVEGTVTHEPSFALAGIKTLGASLINISESGTLNSVAQGIEASGALSLTNNGLINSNAMAVHVDGSGSSSITNNGSIVTKGTGIWFSPSTEHEDTQNITNAGNISAQSSSKVGARVASS